MKHLADIKVPSSQGITIANIKRDTQTGEYLLQDAFSAQGEWYKTLEDLKADWRSISFMCAHCIRHNCTTPTIVFTGEQFGGITLGYHEEELK